MGSGITQSPPSEVPSSVACDEGMQKLQNAIERGVQELKTEIQLMVNFLMYIILILINICYFLSD